MLLDFTSYTNCWRILVNNVNIFHCVLVSLCVFFLFLFFLCEWSTELNLLYSIRTVTSVHCVTEFLSC